MKHLLLIGLTLLVLGSCKKGSNENDDNEEPTPRTYYIKYKADGRQITHEGEWQWQPTSVSGVQSRREPLGIGTDNKMKLVVDGRTGANEVFHLIIVSDSVKTGENYLLDNDGYAGRISITVNGVPYESQRSGLPNLMKIHIDKHTDGWITGTFSGNLGGPASTTSPTGQEQMKFTEGSFSSKVVYK